MTQLYARVFVQILDSSLAEDYQTRHVFEDLLKLADGGIVDMTRQSIARRTNVPLDVINKALEILESPDPASRDAAEDGRRLVRLDTHRDWGWIIVNWDKYEAIKKGEDQRLKTAERTRRWRERKMVSPTPPSSTDSASTSASASEEPSPKRHPASQSVTPSANGSSQRPAGAGPASEEEWIVSLAQDPTYRGIDVQREHGKLLRWCEQNRKEPTRRRFVNWLNRADVPVTTTPKPLPQHRTGTIDPNTLQ